MKYGFTKADVEEATERVLKRIMKQQDIYSPVAQPILYLLGGQPGAGKSTISDRLLKENPNAIFINPDTYRELHPQYEVIKAELQTDAVQVTVEFSGAVTEQVRRVLSDQKYNLIVEGTFRTLETPLRIAKELKAKGYIAELHAIAVPKDISYVGTLDRYFVGKSKGTGRAVDKRHHDLVVEKLPIHLKALAESGMFQVMRLHTREKEIFSTACDAEGFVKQFQREVGRCLDFEQEKKLSRRIDFVNQALMREEHKGIVMIAGTPIAEIRKELQAILIIRNISMER